MVNALNLQGVGFQLPGMQPQPSTVIPRDISVEPSWQAPTSEVIVNPNSSTVDIPDTNEGTASQGLLRSLDIAPSDPNDGYAREYAMSHPVMVESSTPPQVDEQVSTTVAQPPQDSEQLSINERLGGSTPDTDSLASTVQQVAEDPLGIGRPTLDRLMNEPPAQVEGSAEVEPASRSLLSRLNPISAAQGSVLIAGIGIANATAPGVLTRDLPGQQVVQTGTTPLYHVMDGDPVESQAAGNIEAVEAPYINPDQRGDPSLQLGDYFGHNPSDRVEVDVPWYNPNEVESVERLETPVVQEGQIPSIFTFPSHALFFNYLNIMLNKNVGASKNSDGVPVWQANLDNPNPDRHALTNINQGTNTKPWNSIAEPYVNMQEDCDLIRSGQAERQQDKFIVNGRTYGHHNGGLYPETGPGLHRLSQPEFKAFKIFNSLGINERSERIASRQGEVYPVHIEAAKQTLLYLQEKYPEVYHGLLSIY